VGQPGVQPVAGSCGRDAVEPGVGARGRVGLTPAGRVTEDELCAVPRRAAVAGRLGRRSAPQYSVGTHPHQQPDRQVGEQQRQPGTVVAGVGDDPEVRITRLPLPGRDQPLHHLAQLAGCDGGSVVARGEPADIQRRGLRAVSEAVTSEYGQPGIIM
jgi:hypothetical protein